MFNHSSFRHGTNGYLNADSDQIKALTQNIEKTPLKLDTNEVIDGQEILASFECLVCKSIPIQPVQCDNCDALFCKQCILDNKRNVSYRNKEKCPHCK
jgi:hypothetical protein